MLNGFSCDSGAAPGIGSLVLGELGKSYQIGDDPKSLLSGHSTVSWRALDIFSVMATPSALEAFIVSIVHQETCWQD